MLLSVHLIEEILCNFAKPVGHVSPQRYVYQSVSASAMRTMSCA